LSLRLAAHLDYLRAEFAAAEAAPLSARKARLVALLADAYVDRLFAGSRGDADILAYRAALAARHAALAAIFALASGSATLVTEAVEVPLDDYPLLGLADFMVSLYNGHTVQRVRVAMPDGSRLMVHQVLAEAIDALAKETGVSS
jgi:hypothetical protein